MALAVVDRASFEDEGSRKAEMSIIGRPSCCAATIGLSYRDPESGVGLSFVVLPDMPPFDCLSRAA
jgi:hypothetical protein